MNYILLILVFAAGLVAGFLLIRKSKSGLSDHNAERREKVEEAKEGIMKMLAEKESFYAPSAAESFGGQSKASKDGQARITNDDVEKALGVSHNTAVRYLDELERDGRLRQVGKTGKYTYYEKF